MVFFLLCRAPTWRDGLCYDWSSQPPPAGESPSVGFAVSENRRIRVFVSSTFRDMAEERNELMTHAWPELRRVCRERQVELVEVDLRWGISEEQSTRRETLKLCLDEIRSCRPFFIGVLGERYGWVPGDDAFTADLREEQPWLRGASGKSVTELEILHGVLNEPEMAGRSFFYFRDPAYAASRGGDYLAENEASAGKQFALKALIRKTCAEKHIPLREDYPHPQALAWLVVDDLKDAIEAQFPIESIPDPLAREARDHEAFAETRRRTYIGRPEYFAQLDRHALADGPPLALLGESGGGKSALLANWVNEWRASHPQDFIFQHYIGSTPDSADHWRLMARLIAEIRRWSGDPDDIPRSHDELLRDFPVWLAKARARAELRGLRCIVVLDALNQLEDRDHARLLGWLPRQPFSGPLRLIVSTLPAAPPAGDTGKNIAGDPLQAVTDRGWETLEVEPLTGDERRQMIAQYLLRFGKKLEPARIERLAGAPAAANPLYLKILLDELRVTGTHDRLDERLTEYLSAGEIPALLDLVLKRYQRDYERERPGLVSESLGLMWAARRGLSENEILRLLSPPNLPHLPTAIWSALRAALEESLVDRGGILNFAHEFLRSAVEQAFVPDKIRRDELRLRLANDMEKQPVSARSCDELPWLLAHTGSVERLRACLLDIDRFLGIFERDEEELMRYWVGLGEEPTMGEAYLASFERWERGAERGDLTVALTATRLYRFLLAAGLYAQAEQLIRRALQLNEQHFGPEHPEVAISLNNLANVLANTGRLVEALPLQIRACNITEARAGELSPILGNQVNNLGTLFGDLGYFKQAGTFVRLALLIFERTLGPEHQQVAVALNNLAVLLEKSGLHSESELLQRRALSIDERALGPQHPAVARDLNNLAISLSGTSRLAEAESAARKALEIDEQSVGPNHPNTVRTLLSLAVIFQGSGRQDEAEKTVRRCAAAVSEYESSDPALKADVLASLGRTLAYQERYGEAEPFLREALGLYEQNLRANGAKIAGVLSDLAIAAASQRRFDDAEALLRRELAIEEQQFGLEHSQLTLTLGALGKLLQSSGRSAEAAPLFRRALSILEKGSEPDNPQVLHCAGDLAQCLRDAGSFDEAETLMRQNLGTLFRLTSAKKLVHPLLRKAVSDYSGLLRKMGTGPMEIFARLDSLAGPFGLQSTESGITDMVGDAGAVWMQLAIDKRFPAANAASTQTSTRPQSGPATSELPPAPKIPPSPPAVMQYAPKLKSAKVREQLRLGIYSVALLADIEADGPVKYAYLAVVIDPDQLPCFFVTSEVNSFARRMLDGGSHWLCVIHPGGHMKLKASNDWADESKFKAEALRIVSEVFR